MAQSVRYAARLGFRGIVRKPAQCEPLALHDCPWRWTCRGRRRRDAEGTCPTFAAKTPAMAQDQRTKKVSSAQSRVNAQEVTSHVSIRTGIVTIPGAVETRISSNPASILERAASAAGVAH
eukprot:6190369-Pleurochrysis_carterae.AAC.6